MKNIKQIAGVPCVLGKVHMLATEDYHGKLIWHYPNIKDQLRYSVHKESNKEIANYLYITTDEEINLGDKVLNTVTGEIYSAELYDIDDFRENDPEFGYTDFNKKIVSTTNPKFLARKGQEIKEVQERLGEPFPLSIMKSDWYLPQPSQAFIKAYCEQGGIDEVDVEYEIVNEESAHKFQPGATIINHYLKLKVDPIHNTITTHRIVEKMYSREEVKKLLEKVKQIT